METDGRECIKIFSVGETIHNVVEILAIEWFSAN